MDGENTLVAAASGISKQAIDLSATVNPILASTSPLLTSAFAGVTSGIASQLLAVAKMIEARAATGAKRQIFFVSLGGFDTHNNELATQRTLFDQLSPALNAFYNATAALGVAGNVTTFTLSDFGRTFGPAAGGGSDHAWGNHHMILGGAVHGGTLYGHFPEACAQMVPTMRRRKADGFRPRRWTSTARRSPRGSARRIRSWRRSFRISRSSRPGISAFSRERRLISLSD